MMTTFAALRRLVWKDLKQHRAEFLVFVCIGAIAGTAHALTDPFIYARMFPILTETFKQYRPGLTILLQFLLVILIYATPFVIVSSVHSERTSGSLYQTMGLPVSRTLFLAAKFIVAYGMLIAANVANAGAWGVLKLYATHGRIVDSRFHTHLYDVICSWSIFPFVLFGIMTFASGVGLSIRRYGIIAGIVAYVVVVRFIALTYEPVRIFLHEMFNQSQYFDMVRAMSISNSIVLDVLKNVYPVAVGLLCITVGLWLYNRYAEV